jgi:mRNA export factor
MFTRPSFHRPSSAFSYDWSKGYQGAVPTNQTKVMLHQVAPEEIKPKAKTGK